MKIKLEVLETIALIVSLGLYGDHKRCIQQLKCTHSFASNSTGDSIMHELRSKYAHHIYFDFS